MILSSRPFIMADTVSVPIETGVSQIQNNMIKIFAYQAPAFIQSELVEWKTRSSKLTKIHQQYSAENYILYPTDIVQCTRTMSKKINIFFKNSRKK